MTYRCRVCRRPLRDPVSIARGIGADCWDKLHPRTRTSTRTSQQALFDPQEMTMSVYGVHIDPGSLPPDSDPDRPKYGADSGTAADLLRAEGALRRAYEGAERALAANDKLASSFRDFAAMAQRHADELVERRAEVERLRGLLTEALDGWRRCDDALCHAVYDDHSGEFCERGRIAEIRREAGL